MILFKIVFSCSIAVRNTASELKPDVHFIMNTLQNIAVFFCFVINIDIMAEFCDKTSHESEHKRLNVILMLQVKNQCNVFTNI